MACRIQFSDQGSKLAPPALGAQTLGHWTSREIPRQVNFYRTRELIVFLLEFKMVLFFFPLSLGDHR